MIQIKPKTFKNLTNPVEKARQNIVRTVKTDLVRRPKHDCFVPHTSKVNKVITIDSFVKEIKCLILKQLEKNKQVLNPNNEYNEFIKMSKAINFPSSRIKKYILDINRFKEGVTDPIIKKEIIKKVTDANNFGELDYEINACKKLVELDSSMQNHSYSLNGDNYKVIKHLQNNFKAAKIIDEIKQTPLGQTLKTYEAKLLKNEMELDSLKSYLMEYSQTEPKLTKYLYEKYYLPRLSPDTKSICQKISDEFNTKLFIEDESNPKAGLIVYDELAEWKRAGKEDFFAPSTINLSRYESDYIEDPETAAYCCVKESIHINGADDITYALRHELLHMNDGQLQESGIINGIDIDKIIVRKPNGDLGDKCLHKDEFFNAGLFPSLIDYAYTDAREFKAVASEGDYSRYSTEFKELLIKIGFPKYVFDIKPSNPKFVNKANYIAKIKQNNPNLKTMDDVKSYITNLKHN